MERIASFTVDHTVLTPGLYLSRRDGNVVTFDLRFKKPNTGDLLSNSEMHSVEHVVATLLRNSEHKDAVVYFGPMGCQTGFYFLFDGNQLTNSQAIALLQDVFPMAQPITSLCPAAAPSSAATIKTSVCRRPKPAAHGTAVSSPRGRKKSWFIPQNNAEKVPETG